MISVTLSSISSEPSSAALENFSCQVVRSFATTFRALSLISSSLKGVFSGDSVEEEETDGEMEVEDALEACADDRDEDIDENVEEAKEADEELNLRKLKSNRYI